MEEVGDSSSSDRGWNDPPHLAYRTGTSDPEAGKKCHKLTKHIAFPSMTSGSQPVSVFPNTNSNIVPKFHSALPPARDASISQLSKVSSTCIPSNAKILSSETETPSQTYSIPENKDKLRDDTLDGLKKCLECCRHTMQVTEQLVIVGRKTIPTSTAVHLNGSSEEKGTADSIARRLDALVSMWMKGKLHEDVQRKMYILSRDLWSGDYDKANNAHLALIVDHSNQVTPWMVGIKHLIQESRIIQLHKMTQEQDS